MNTPAKPSAVAAFLGEAAAPEATVTTTITGTPTTVQKAIQKLAKKPAKKIGAPSPAADAPPPEEPEELAPEGEEIDIPAGEGDDEPLDDLPAPKGPPRGAPKGRMPFESRQQRQERAANIVEALIQEKPAAK